MNILYINHYAGSPKMGMEFRPYYLAREWIKNGHSVRVVAGDYSHLRTVNPIVERDFYEEVIDGINYSWIKTGEYKNNGVARALSMIRFVWKIWRKSGRIAKDWMPDVIITSSTYPIDTFAGQRIKKKTNKKAILIHEVHDMWPITLLELGGMKRSNPFVQLMQIGENSFCKHSDIVVSLLCSAKDYFIQHGMEPEKFRVVMNGVVLDEWLAPNPLPKNHQILLRQLHKDGKFIICFFGSITKSYALEYLLEATKLLNDSRVAIVIVGEGNYKQDLVQKAMEIENVYFLSRIEKASIPTLLENIDCSYIGALHNDMFRFGVCMNKLFDAMMGGKPILYAVEAPNNFVKDYNCGISVKAEDSLALKEGIDILLNMDEENRTILGQNGKNAVLHHFTYPILAKAFLDGVQV